MISKPRYEFQGRISSSTKLLLEAKVEPVFCGVCCILPKPFEQYMQLHFGKTAALWGLTPCSETEQTGSHV